jgi:integrase
MHASKGFEPNGLVLDVDLAGFELTQFGYMVATWRLHLGMGEKVNITAGRVAEFQCRPGKAQDFLRDVKSPWLAVRVTAGGSKSFVFESKLNGTSIREVIGSTNAWTIEAARQAANEKKTLVDRGLDPRELRKEAITAGQAKLAAEKAKVAEQQQRSIRVVDVWPQYLNEGKPRRKEAWKPRYLADLRKAVAAGGEPKRRGGGVTKPGPLFSLMDKRLMDIDQDMMRDWFTLERQRGPTQAARALAMFAGFLSWCSTKRQYRGLVHADAAQASKLQDILPAKTFRTDALEVSQLPAWFAAVQQLPNKTAATYLIALVLTGARREEMAALKWGPNVDFRWDRLTLADKVGSTRTIPLTPFLKRLFERLQVVEGNPFVFATPGTQDRRLTEPRSAHSTVLKASGIGHCTIHGLRRTFALLAETAGAPAGAIAQVMGHRPSAVSEKYKPRPIDMLRLHLVKVESFILETSGVRQPGAAS